MRSICIFVSLVLGAFGCRAYAGTIDTWTGATGNFGDGTQWQNGGPSAWTSGGDVILSGPDDYATVEGAYDLTGDPKVYLKLKGDATVAVIDGADLSVYRIYLGDQGIGHILQTGGALAVTADCYAGSGPGSTGNYTISGGSLWMDKYKAGGSNSGSGGTEATLTVIGDDAVISMRRLYVGAESATIYGKCTLEFRIAETGVSPMEVTGEFHLDEAGALSTANLVVTTEAVLGAEDIVLINLTDSGAIDGGTFDTLNGGSAAEGTQISLGGNLYELTYAYDVGGAGHYNDVALVFVEGGTSPGGAHTPDPQDDAVVDGTLALLGWVNPDPNVPGTPVTCTVFFGTAPDRQQMDHVTLGADISEVSINTANFPMYGNLVNQTHYYWAVDAADPSTQPDPIPGDIWSFFVYDNIAPAADAGPDQVVWLGMSGTPAREAVILDGATSDDGSYTVLWTQVANGAPAVSVSPADVDDTSVTITERGTYELMLTADDGVRQTSDTVQIIVGEDSCDASHMSTGLPYDAEDMNRDCVVDLADFALLFAEDWLVCTDTLTHCGN